MGLENILNSANKKELDLDAEATEEYIRAHIKDFRDLIAY